MEDGLSGFFDRIPKHSDCVRRDDEMTGAWDVESTKLARRPRTVFNTREISIAAVLTPLYLLVRGYSFGIRDHGIYLPYIERAAHPDFLPGDPMLALADRHSSLFFEALALLSRFVPLEVLYCAGHLLSVFVMLFAIRALALALWSDGTGQWTAAVAVAGVFVHRNVAGGIENFDAIFLPRVASLGPLLCALALGVRGRHLLAFAVIGVVFLFHATTAAHTALVLWCGIAAAGRKHMRACLLGPIVFLAAASPLLVLMAIRGGPDIPTPAPDEWIQSLKLHYPFHHYPSVWAR